MSQVNHPRSFSMYQVLERPLLDFLAEGDGLHARAVYEEPYYPDDTPVVECTLINLIKFASTAYGRARVPQAMKIIERIRMENDKRVAYRFRTGHPLFVDGTTDYQNLCLISGMVYLGIPILPYFDGVNVLSGNREADEEDEDGLIRLLRPENRDILG